MLLFYKFDYYRIYMEHKNDWFVQIWNLKSRLMELKKTTELKPVLHSVYILKF